MPNETQVEKCKAFVEWLEEERQAAIDLHLDQMAKRMAPDPIAPRMFCNPVFMLH